MLNFLIRCVSRSSAVWLVAGLLAAVVLLPARASHSEQSPAAALPHMVGIWPNVDSMSEMKNAYPAGELHGDAQIAPAVGLPAFAGTAVNAGALIFGGNGYLSVPGQTPALDTSGGYMISAWVKLNHVGGFQTIASMDGQSASPFYLQYRDDWHSFVFATLPADASSGSPPAAQWNAGAKAAAFLTPQPNRWYWLVAFHDAGAGLTWLSLDGVRQQTVKDTGGWKAAGPLTIGRGFYNGKPDDYLDGEVADVEVYQGYHLLNPDRMRQAAARAARLDQAAAIPADIRLDLTDPKTEKPSSPMLYGLMIEDINHSIDGGLYAELIQNRDFKDDPAKPVHWTITNSGSGTGTASIDTTQAPPPGTSLRTSLRLTNAYVRRRDYRPGTHPIPPSFELDNDGYWGVAVNPMTTYRLSFYAKESAGSSCVFLADLQSANGDALSVEGPVGTLSPQWHKYTAAIVTNHAIRSTTNGRLALLISGPGTVWITHVSLMPPAYNNRPNGDRPDLMERLGAMHPAFLRMPGGNFLEGNHIQDWFNWKKTIGPTAGRPGHANPWGYPSTDGFGLLEYLEWCQDLNMEPVLAVYAGYSLSGDYVKPGPDLAPYVQDAVDEIEYVTGDAKTTRWGAVRARDGHPAPFPLRYVEVGNEDWFDKSGSYEAGRFAQFFDAIRAKYPKLQIISTTNAVKSRRPDVIDEHYYLYPQTFVHDAGHYDATDRSAPKIFVGEWASQEGFPTPDMGACLGDAAWLCGLERNSDHVVMASYAPLLVNVNDGAGQWGTNLIGFNGLTSYSSPTAYAQAMFAAARGKTIVPLAVNAESGLIGSATRTQRANGSSTIYVKLVNPTDANVPAHLTLQGLSGVVSHTAATRTLRASSAADTNSIRSPRAVVPVSGIIENASGDFTYPVPPYSVTVMTLRLGGGK